MKSKYIMIIDFNVEDEDTAIIVTQVKRIYLNCDDVNKYYAVDTLQDIVSPKKVIAYTTQGQKSAPIIKPYAVLFE